MVLIVVAISIGGLIEIVPLMLSSDATEPYEGIEPYPALQLAGRDIYVREGCYAVTRSRFDRSAAKRSATARILSPANSYTTDHSSSARSARAPTWPA